LTLKLSRVQAGDAPARRELLEAGGPAPPDCLLLMDGAGRRLNTALARQSGYTPIVPSNPNRLKSLGNWTASPIVKQVAEELGLTDPFHFSREFTSVFELSPTNFRGLR
jgi:AraC-like DNA-binding protein